MCKTKLTKEEKAQLKHEQFLKRMEDTFGDKYTVLGFYTTTAKPILVKHNKCNYEWSPYPANLFSGKSNCPRCSGKEKPTTEMFKKQVEYLTNGEYTVLGTYINNVTNIKFKHLECGFEWDATPDNFKNRESRCSRCINKERYTTETFNEKIIEMTDGDYELVGEYSNGSTIVTLHHYECNKDFEILPTRFLNINQRCPHCNTNCSKGELAILDYLVKKGIFFQREWTFEDCKNINVLPFDFAIFKENSLIGLIEFDGKQHYEPIEWFGGEETFKGIQFRDSIKNEYCKENNNNIPLLRIPYWEENNIEEILHDYFKKLISIN